MRLPPEVEAKVLAQATPAAPARPVTVEAAPLLLPWSLSLTLPVAVVSRANRREHWSVTHRRGTLEARALEGVLFLAGLLPAWPNVPKPVRVRLTRVYKGGRPMDGDNLGIAFKAYRDAVAKWLEIDDGSEAVQWFYGQERGAVPCCRVEVLGGSERG